MKIFTSSPSDLEQAQLEALAAGWTQEELSRAGYSKKWVASSGYIYTISLPENDKERYQLFRAQYQDNN